MDNNTHGFDLHADLKFDEGWSFTAGAQSTGTIPTISAITFLLKWHANFGN